METIQTNLAARRIVVLIPDSLTTELGLAHRIHRLAVEKDCPVLYVTVVRDPQQMLTISRCMTTLAAATSGNLVSVDSKLTTSAGLLDTLSKVNRPGDLLVCLENLPTGAETIRITPAGELTTSVVALSTGQKQPAWPRDLLPAAAAVVGFLLIIGGFTWLEIALNQSLHGTLQRILLIAAFCIEVGAIWMWNKFARW